MHHLLLFVALVVVGVNSQSLRCGLTWEDADSRCGVACPAGFDTQCPSPERCFNSVSLAPCSSTTTTTPTTTPPAVITPPVVVAPPPVVTTPTGTIVGIWYWTWSSGITPPAGVTYNLGIAFNGYVDPSKALAESSLILSKLPNKKVLSLGGGNGAGHWTAASLNTIINAIKSGMFDGYTGISYDIEEGDSGLSTLFKAAFAATKARGKTCIVTVSHSAPYAIADAATVMTAIFADTNIDYLSPQLYTTGYETANEWAESGGVSWSKYANCRAKIIPSIVRSSLYEDARKYFLARGVTTAGYIQWEQQPASANSIRCGISWSDANSRCGTSCPSGQDTSCPSGQKCFRDLGACSSTTPPPTTSGKDKRCGITWDDANKRCGTLCPAGTDAICPSGQHCFANVNPSICGASANEASVVEEQQQTTTTPSNNVGEQVPAWAIALLALGSILVVGVFTALVVLLKPLHHNERV